MVYPLRCLVFLCALLLWLPRPLRAQVLDPTFHIPEVYTEAAIADVAQMPNGQLVVGGDFTRVNSQVGKSLARFNVAGVEDQVFRQNLSAATVSVIKLMPMSNGQLMVLGNYTAGAVQRRYLFRLNADGTLDAGFNLALPGAGTFPTIMQAIPQPDGRVLITGLYLSGNGSNSELFRVLSDGSRDPSFSVSLTTDSQGCRILLQPDGKFIVQGDFTQLNGVTGRKSLVRLNSDGSTDTGFQAPTYSPSHGITSIALDANGAVLVSALAPPYPLLRLLSNGATDPTFSATGIQAGRSCLLVKPLSNGQIAVLASTYEPSTGVDYPLNNQLIKLESNGAIDAAFQQGDGPDAGLNGVLGQANGSLLTWGNFNNFSGQHRTLALLQANGGLDASFAPLLQRPGTVVKIVCQADGKLLVAGRFNSIDGHLTDQIARLLPNGQPDRTFAWRQRNSSTWRLSALAVQADGKVIVAGDIYNGDLINVFVRLTTTGAPDASFAPVFTAPVAPSPSSSSYKIQLLASLGNGQLVVGGSFVDAAGKINITRLTTSGAVDPTFTPSLIQPDIFYGVAQTDGSFICIVAAPAPAYKTIVRLLPSGVQDPTFAYIPTNVRDDSMQRIAQVPGTGDYVVGGVTANATQVLARISATGASITGFIAPFFPAFGPLVPESCVNVVATQNDGKILVGGTLQRNQLNAPQSTPLARLTANGQLDPSFNTAVIANPLSASNLIYGIYSVYDILVQPDDAIMVAGYFLEAAGQPVTGLVRFLPTGVLAVRAEKESSSIQAWPVPAHDELHLQLEMRARPQRVSLLNALGQAVISQPASEAALTLNTASLAPGLYVLRVDYAGGPATRRVVIE
jgi:uncharacterized delta-60 repeat protein